MAYIVEHNIPIPSVSRYMDAIRTFEGMSHGDSFLVPSLESKTITNVIRNRTRRRQPQYKVVTRRYREGVRLWKVRAEY